jgi:hypothetical protein
MQRQLADAGAENRATAQCVVRGEVGANVLWRRPGTLIRGKSAVLVLS